MYATYMWRAFAGTHTPSSAYSRALFCNRSVFDSAHKRGGDFHVYGMHLYAEKSTAYASLIY